MLEKYFPEDWIKALGAERLTEILTNISTRLVELRQEQTVLPEAGDPLLFQAFRETPLQLVKAVIIGQDPYHDGSYNGLCFGNGTRDEFKKKKISPSLRPILAEVARTEFYDANPNLYNWAAQGVLLINTAHSVQKGIPGGHIKLWEPFTTAIISALNTRPDIVWMLWGNFAQGYIPQITNPTHHILRAGHPSPLNSAHPFAGCNCFSECNTILKAKKYEPIIWK
jgi:uracil-DNA glycosylase